MAANTEIANIHSEYSHWLNVHGQLSDREHSEIKNTVMFSTSTVNTYLLTYLLTYNATIIYG